MPNIMGHANPSNSNLRPPPRPPPVEVGAGMITVDGMRALRISATLAHAAPALRVRLRHGDRAHVEVAAEHGAPGAAGGAGLLRLSPCQYRMAVAKGWAMQGLGRPIRLLDLPGDPAVDVGVPPGGATLATGIHRVPFGGRHLFVTATTLGVDAVHAAVADDPDDDLEAMADLWDVGLRADPATDVTVVWAELDAGDRGLQHALLETLERVVVRLAVAELVAGSAGAASPTER